jgi:Ni2+-binding GTPase involved in maturation of urease and hydrogenase
MRVITVSGPPSVGKTSVVLKTVAGLAGRAGPIGVVKFDSLSTSDDAIYAKAGLPVVTGLAGGLCPDHFFVSNIDDCLSWAKEKELDLLVAESAGLCNRCSPHIQGILGICVVDALSGIHTPRKIGPMLKFADIVVITKGDIVSQAEREVFAFNVQAANPNAIVMSFNGLTGQGATELGFHLAQAPDVEKLEGSRLRFPMPSAVCPYCIGETLIGPDHQRGNVRKMSFGDMAQ